MSSSSSLAIPKVEFLQLPHNVRPTEYFLTLEPNFSTFIYEGHVDIRIEIYKDTKQIILNSADLDLENASISGNNEKIPIKNIKHRMAEEIVVLKLPKTISKGRYEISINFKGFLHEHHLGFFRMKFSNKTGETEYGGVTQFQPTGARRCFPCWDEPGYKAIFNIKVTHPNHLVALSNMPVVKMSSDGTLCKTEFEPTPKMSSFLVAFIVGDFDYISDKLGNTEIRVYAAPNTLEDYKFSLEVTKNCLVFYENYFGLPYPLQKIDIVSTSSFQLVGMENWGLLIMKDTAIVLDLSKRENLVDLTKRSLIALDLAHLICQQWIGNLVTLEWWTYLWLSESFASFMQYICIEAQYPAFDVWARYFKITSYVQKVDTESSCHPIEIYVKDPQEVADVFDPVILNKGVTLFRMLRAYLGEHDFKVGMINYLRKHMYNNASSGNLWEVFEEVSGKPVGIMMTTWIRQIGFPILFASTITVDGKVILRLKQCKFLGDGKILKRDCFWMIPIFISTPNRTNQMIHLMQTKKTDIELGDENKNSWLYVNANSPVFLVVKYSKQMLANFAQAIRSMTLAEWDRITLLWSTMWFAECGYCSTIDVLQLLLHFENEEKFEVWQEISYTLTKLEAFLAGSSVEQNLKNFETKLFKAIYEKVGWIMKEDEPEEMTRVRALILVHMAKTGDPIIIAQAQKWLQMDSVSQQQFPDNIKLAIYVAVTQIYPESFKVFKNLYLNSNNEVEKQRIVSALGSFKEPDQIKEVLEFSEQCNSEDAFILLTSLSLSSPGKELLWEYIKNNWHSFEERFKNEDSLKSLLKLALENYSTEEKCKEIEKFFSKTKVPRYMEDLVNKVTSKINSNIARKERDMSDIIAFLKEYN